MFIYLFFVERISWDNHCSKEQCRHPPRWVAGIDLANINCAHPRRQNVRGTVHLLNHSRRTVILCVHWAFKHPLWQ